jgi:AcrR family transcriptional regulator
MTTQGLETRRRLYETAIGRIATRGWQETTLRDVAQEAGVSVGLLYRYFPSKRAVVLELYDRLSSEYAAMAVPLQRGRWRDRFIAALTASLDVLRPHRATLAALTPVLVGVSEEGLFAPQTAFSRQRVQTVFDEAVTGATDAPDPTLGAALGRLLYLLHLGVILWWQLDRSPEQRATDQLVVLLRRALPLFATVMRLPPVRGMLLTGDRLFREALLEPETTPSNTEQPARVDGLTG